MVGVLPHVGHRHLVGAPRSLDRDAVDRRRARPALRGAQDDHRPARSPARALVTGRVLDVADLVERVVERLGERLVDELRVVTADQQRPVPVALEQRDQLALRDPREHRRVGDLVAVQVEDRQHRAVDARVEELVRVPARRQRPGLGLAVADDAADEQVGVVERRAVRVRERVAELAALVDRAGRLRRGMAGDPAREGELAEQLPHARLVGAHVRVQLAVRPLEIGVGDDARPAVARAGDVDRVEVAGTDRAVQVRVDQIQAGRRAEVAEQPRLDVLGEQRLAEERVVEQVDLADREVVRGPPVGVDQAELVDTHSCYFSRSGAAGHRRACRRCGFRPARCRAARAPRGRCGALR